MRSYDRFIITPYGGDNYINTAEIGGQEFIVNASIEYASDVNRVALIVETPYNYTGDLKKGDVVICQHNTFRMVYNDKGVVMQSNNNIKDNLFYSDPDLLYLLIKEDGASGIDDSVFIQPITEETRWEGVKEIPQIGIVKYSNNSLNQKGITPGTKIVFRKSCQYEFNIKGEKLYKMTNNRVLATLN